MIDLSTRKPRTKAVKYAEEQSSLKHISFKHSDGFIERLDDWRSKRRPILSRSAAIKLMCEERMRDDANAEKSA